MPKGGFGNLIALPLAGGHRKMGNTVFLDDHLEPCADQWTFLKSIQRLLREELDRILGQITPMTALASVGSEDIAFALESDECALDLSRPSIKAGMIAGDVTLRLDSCLHVPRTIPVAVLAALKRLATFANPVFHHKLRLRFATYDTPRFIFAGEWHPDRLVLPRGAMSGAVAILESAGANVTIQDVRPDGDRVGWAFHGELRPEQKVAVEEMAKHDYGVLCAPPGAGPTPYLDVDSGTPCAPLRSMAQGGGPVSWHRETKRDRSMAWSNAPTDAKTRHRNAAQPGALRGSWSFFPGIWFGDRR